MKLNSVEELIEDIRAGKMVVLMDDEDRENEGDIVMAAEHCRAEDINFMAPCPWLDLHADDTRALSAARPAADGAGQ
jgi:hypothetical protein